MCLKCEYNTSMPVAQQKCNDSSKGTCNNSSNLTYCEVSILVKTNDVKEYKKGCSSALTCDTSVPCKPNITASGVKDCARECCKDKDLCNKDFPPVPGGYVDRVTVGQVAMLASLLLAMLFV